MRWFYTLAIFIALPSFTLPQSWQQATMNDQFIMSASKIKAPSQYALPKTITVQMTGFPLAVTGNATFKNFRGLALADINGDSITDIIFATHNAIYAYSYQGLIWQKSLIGTAIYPPSVSDMNNDGYPEIVQVTGGSPDNGHIYVFDHNGNTLAGWPVNFSNHWIICSPALADVNNDNLKEIAVCERAGTAGKVHLLKLDGTEFSADWPVTLDGIPAVTPSVGDVDGDGFKEIVVNSTKSRYIFGLDGTPKSGFPLVTEPLQKYSYQSPVIVDLDNNGHCEIVGATHGDSPLYYVMNSDGSSYNGWPHNVPDSSWTYSAPTVVKINGNWKIFMSRPIGSDADDMLYGWDAAGNMLPGFPIVKAGGLEGFISVADINNDNEFELVFGSNLLDSTGHGFIHAYKTDGSGELPGFLIRPRGWTFMNGVNIGDVNGDNMMDLVALSYTNSFGATSDSVYINVYELNVPYTMEKVLWGTYKGSNERTGFVGEMISNIQTVDAAQGKISVYPNPVMDKLKLTWNNFSKGKSLVKITDITGRIIQKFECPDFPIGEATLELDISALQAGCYFAILETTNPPSPITIRCAAKIIKR